MKFIRSLTVIATVAMFAAACGGHDAPSIASPITASPTARSANGATISGNVLGTASSSAFSARGVSITVSVNNSSSASAVDASGHFSLTGVPTGHVELHFNGPGLDAQLSFDDVADHETIDITVHITAGTVQLDDSHRTKPDHRDEIEGRVQEVNAAARTLKVRDIVVAVPTTATIRHGSTTMTFAQIKMNDHVEIKATNTGTEVTAQEVKVETEHAEDGKEPDENEDDARNEVEVSGTVTIQSRSCPSTMTFTVGTSTTVVTKSDTEFRNTSCATLANGDNVEVKGTKQANGSVLARRVEKKK